MSLPSELHSTAVIEGYPLEWFERDLPEACASFSFDQAAAAMRPYASDDLLIRSHYPWVAFAVRSYRRGQARGRHSDDIERAETVKLLRSISKNAEQLAADLHTLDKTVDAPLLNGNVLKWFALQRANFLISSDFGDDTPSAMQGIVELQSQLLLMTDAAAAAAEKLGRDPKGKVRSGPGYIGAGGFINVLARVWSGITTPPRTATAERKADGSDPDFVVFVATIAKAAALRAPTRATIRNVLRLSTHPPKGAAAAF